VLSVTEPTTIFRARAIHTLDPAVPSATAVAVRDGRILAVGEPTSLVSAYGGSIDDRLAEHVLLPGFVEAHSHLMEGAIWEFPYVGYFDRRDPDGRLWEGCSSILEVVDRLRELNASMADPDEPLIAWGLDPIYFPGDRLVAEHLDRVCERRPIFVMHASLHLATVNTALMRAAGIDAETQSEGVPKDGNGDPIGELREPASMALAGAPMFRFFSTMRKSESIARFGELARRVGVTTLTDLGTTSLADDDNVDRLLDVTSANDFPARLSVFATHNMIGADPDAAAQRLVDLRARSTDRMRFGHAKLVLDGSIQGFTARLRWPGYFGGEPNGIWVIPPEQVAPSLEVFHRAGATVHVHCNGDEAVDVLLDAMESVLAAYPRADHRHTVQHCQLTTPGQYRRMRALGMCANLFSNHVFYWGDQHASSTVGPDRAARMNAAATALRIGVPLSIHSDASVTPLGPLHVAWCAVNRLTASGVVLGPEERIGVAEALRAITLGAAHQLKLDDELGSIAPGKRADFAVLTDDPFVVDPTELRNVGVAGTVLGGTLQVDL
jgi:predicted amidohydrolase YtcJ